MSSIDSDHNHYSLEPRQKISQPSLYNPAKRSKVSAIVGQNTSSTSLNGTAGSAPRGDSPDPHDFYRRHQDQYRTMLGEGSGQGEIRVQQNGGAAPRVNAPKLSLSSRVSSRYNTSPTERSPLSAAKSSPTLSSTARHRQTSLKELVNRFNQTPDEALPLPRKSTSRSPSASPHTIRARTSSLSNRSGIPPSTKLSTSPKTKKPLRSQQRADPPNSSRPYASQSTTNLAETHSRKPLFGEILAMSPTHGDSGYGIPPVRQRRRGSEGSMHSPNPMFPQEQNRQAAGITPSSPSAWYLGVTPTLDEIKTEGNIPDRPPNMHRRTRSDFTGAPSRPPTSRMYGTNLSPHRDPPSSPSSTNTSKRNSQSRIPVSTRRLSTASDSGNSTHSTRANSALGRAHMKSPTRNTNAASKYSQYPRSPPHHSRSSTPQKSPRRNEFGTGAKSPRLTAYISAPMPKKSPPLRSSRPRQPVSNASTSASRARVVERFPGSDAYDARSKRDGRTRKPPELAGVDFAARREKIQMAVTQTVREDEHRRASMALESRPFEAQSMSNGNSKIESPCDVLEEQPNIRGEEHQKPAEDRPKTPAVDTPKSERELTINTGHLSERSVLDLSLEDSPTLGTYTRFSGDLCRVPERGTSHSSDIEPSSAITAGTSDSVDTFFDDEPQDDSRDSSRPASHHHDALLNHIANMRDTSPGPEIERRTAAKEESASDKDDRESIHIMLGDTPVLEKAPFKDTYDDKPRDPQLSEGPESRWSMSSWTSSTRSRDEREERDTPMERIDEHSPQSSEPPAHLSMSTSTSDQTPQPWSPASFNSARTARTTMDSDAYSTINRVLDHYHDPTLISPEVMNDVQQHILTHSPDLARQGGWDPKKVTQLYLQELAKKRIKPSSAVPDHIDPYSRQRASSLRVPEAPEKEVRDDLDGKMVEDRERVYDDGTPSGRSLDVDENDSRPARASLNRPDDWDMSPSLGGLEMQAEALDSPATDDKPTLPPKDWSSFKKDLANTPDRPELIPPITGLGLEINLVPPQRNDSPIIPPPPLPVYSPPPPPSEAPPPAGMRSPPSPSIYSKHVPSSIYPPKVSVSDEPIPPLPNIDHSRQPRSVTSSARPSGSSSQSQHQPSVDGPPTSVDTTSKTSSPSPDQKRLIKRGHIIKELVDTEHSFGQDMKVVDDIYKGTANVIIISVEDVKTLFGNSDQIVAFSTSFLDALKRASKSVYVLPKNKRWRSNRISNATSHSETTDDQSSINGVDLSDEDKDRKTFIGEAFGHHMAEMEKVYADYLKNHDAANQKLQALQKNRNIEIWLRECRQYAHDLTSAWDLDSLLVKPVQRILKYPLLLDQLLEATPENHPDFTALDVAAREMKGISMRINEMKRRADIMEQVTKTRKRKESDVRIGLSKAFGRRTEKLRQQVGLSDMIEDKGYSAVSEKFGSHFFQLQVVMRDVEMYTNDVQIFMNRFCDFALAMEAHIDVGGTSYPESESRWRKFRMSTREISMTALTDHIAAVRKNVIEPMTTLLKLHDSPQKLMQKRNKRVMDYARFKALKDRGEKPDKKTIEQGEQYLAVNETLKEDLPKLFTLTGKLVEACLNNFVQLQLQWLAIWRRKLSQAIEDQRVPINAEEIVSSFSQDFKFVDESIMTLGICNGSMLVGVLNQSSFPSASTTLNGDDTSSSRQDSTDLSRRRTLSISSEQSPVLPKPDFGARGSGSFFSDAPQLVHAGLSSGNYVEPSRRMRASSTLSGHSPRTPEVPGSYHSFSNSTTPVNSTPGRPSTATPRTYTDPMPSPSRPSFDSPSFARPSEDSARTGRTSGQTYPTPSSGRTSSPSQRYSGFFSSAMPMSDSPRTESPAPGQALSGFNVIFLAASVYEFNIDRARKEAGYPYLTYVAGEIFDVIGEKGELWLAKNQDDSDNLVGWIWNKHFVKLAS